MLPNKKERLASFEKLAIPYLDFIYRSAYRLCGNRSDAEDLSQETFQRAFEKFNQLRDASKIKSWLFMILRNSYLKKIEQEKKYVHIDVDLVSYNPQDAKNIGKEFFNKTLNGELQQAMDKLTEKYKTPVVLSYIGGYSYQEIADMLHIPIGTVMSRIARGKLFLKKEMIEASKRKIKVDKDK
jgi:RNA polymerase sigma-70 factor (ECF subfamily)